MFIYGRNCESWGIQAEYDFNTDNEIGNFVGKLHKQGETCREKQNSMVVIFTPTAKYL